MEDHTITAQKPSGMTFIVLPRQEIKRICAPAVCGTNGIQFYNR